MEIRPATIEDLPSIFEVYSEVASEARWIGAELPLDKEARVASWHSYFTTPGSVMFVAEDGGEIVGMADLKARGPAELGMFVSSNHRGKGIGAALLDACIEWAKANGHYKMALQVWPHNEAAIALYESRGFEREGYLKHQWRRKSGEIWDSVVMGLILDREAGSESP